MAEARTKMKTKMLEISSDVEVVVKIFDDLAGAEGGGFGGTRGVNGGRGRRCGWRQRRNLREILRR